MAKIADLFVELGLRKEKFDKGMDQAGKSTTSLNSKFGQLAAGMASAFSIAAIIAFTKGAMQAYDVQAKAEAGLLAALGGRRDMQESLIRQASELQGETLFGDEATIEAQTLMATLGLTGAQIKELTPRVQDMAVALKMDLTTAASLVSKSIMTSTDALGRYGIELKGGTTAQEKYALYLEKTAKMQGRAAVEAGVGTGAITQASNAFGDFGEVLGKVVATKTSGFFKELTTELSDTTTALNSEVIPAWRKLFGLINTNVGFMNKLQAEAYNKFKENHDKELTERLNALELLKQDNQQRIKLLKEEAAEKEKNAKKAAEEAEKLRREVWDKNTAAIMEQMELEQMSSDAMRANIAAAIADHEKEIEALNAKAAAYKEAMSVQFTPDEEGYIDDGLDEITNKFLDIQDKTQAFIDGMNSLVQQFVADFVIGFSEGIGNLITGDAGFDDLFNNILSSFGNFIKQMGAAMIAYGATMIAFKMAMTNPFALIAAGAALVIAGTVISNLASSGPSMSGSAGGGGGGSSAGMTGYSNGVTGYANTGGMADYVLTTQVSGDDLRFIMQRAERNATRRV